jgi:hypothetical protein
MSERMAARPRTAELALLLSHDGAVLEDGESLLALAGSGVNPLGAQFHTLLHLEDRDQVKQLTCATGETVLLRLRDGAYEWEPYQARAESQALRAGRPDRQDLRDPGPDPSLGEQAMRLPGTTCGRHLHRGFRRPRRPSGASPDNPAIAPRVAS